MWQVPVGRQVRFHLVGAMDKPRNQSFTIHGVAWREWRFPSSTNAPMVASESAISCGTARTFVLTPAHVGDHAYRSGVLKWGVSQGLWGVLRVVEHARASGSRQDSEEANIATTTTKGRRTVGRRLAALAWMAVGVLAARHTAKARKDT